MRLLGLLLLAAAVVAGDPEPVRVPPVLDLNNAKDPVSAARSVPGSELTWKGVRIRFAAEDNHAKFKESPARYVAVLGFKIEKDVLDLQNRACAVTGGKVDGKTFVERDGVRVHLSGPEAKPKLAADPKRAFARLGYTYHPAVIDLGNTRCPVTGDQCYPEAPIWADVEGIRIRVCCDNCVREVEEFPKRVFRSLMVDPEELKKRFR